jgi:hypothetical protein
MWIDGIRIWKSIIENIIGRIVSDWESKWNWEYLEIIETIFWRSTTIGCIRDIGCNRQQIRESVG